jgi:thioredoxin reductase
MRHILAMIERKKQGFSKLPLFEFMRDSAIDPLHRLAFAPCATQFVMNFADLNRYVFRDEPTTDPIQSIINKHTYEDDHHWHWFLEDLEKLGLNPQESVTETLKSLWSDESRVSRQVSSELYRLTFKGSPVRKLAAIEATEATGNAMLAATSQIIRELTSDTQQEYRYFGSGHLIVDTGHTYCSSESKRIIENIRLSESEERDYLQVVDEIFAVFTDFTHELLAYAKQHPPTNSLTATGQKDTSKIEEVDYLIVGAGPAGLQLGYFLEQANQNYLILEAGDSPATSFKQFPRHRQLISINKRHTGFDDPEINMRWDWNSLLNEGRDSLLFTHYTRDYFPSADTLVEYLQDFAEKFKLKIQHNAKVVRITKDQKFQVTDQLGRVYVAKRLILATGVSKLYLPPIPGIELAESYTDVSVEPEAFLNQKVLIIGKGNSGFETANNLVETAALIHIASPNPISMAWKSRYVGHLRAVNNTILDTYQLKSQNLVLNAKVDKIRKQGEQYVVSVSYTHANGEQEDLIYDRVIVCTGFRFDASIFDDSCKPELTINNRFPAQTSEWESINVKDLYFAGVLMHMRDFKKKASGFIHGFRYNIQALHRIFAQKYHQQSWPSHSILPTAESLTSAIIERINKSSALWQQTGFLGDLIVVPRQDNMAQYYPEVPVDYILDSDFAQQEHYYTITLEFGYDILEASPDPFAITRVHKDDIKNASQSPSLHPIVRHYCGTNLIAEHHIIEDIDSVWNEEVHVQPLLAFLRTQLSVKQKRLGTYLLEAGLVTSEQLELALREQKDNPILLGHLLSNKGWVNQQTIEYLVENVILPVQKVARLERELVLQP